MKKALLLLFLIPFIAFGQKDVVFLKDSTKVICSITLVTDSTIDYQRTVNNVTYRASEPLSNILRYKISSDFDSPDNAYVLKFKMNMSKKAAIRKIEKALFDTFIFVDKYNSDSTLLITMPRDMVTGNKIAVSAFVVFIEIVPMSKEVEIKMTGTGINFMFAGEKFTTMAINSTKYDAERVWAALRTVAIKINPRKTPFEYEIWL